MSIGQQANQVKQLKREGNYLGAVQILEEMISYQEKEARKTGYGVAPWAYDQLAIVARKIKNYDAEIEVLERFMRQPHAMGGSRERLLERLVRAYELGGKLEKRVVRGDEVLFHTEKNAPLDELDIFVRTAAIVDCETTGLTNEDELIELGIITFRYNTMSGKVLEVMDEYSGLRQPRCKISKEAQAVHGLTRRELKGQSIEGARVRALLKQVEILFAHNAAFDKRFISEVVPEVDVKDWYCSMNTIPWRKRGFSSKGLQNLLLEHDLGAEASHRALADCRALLSLLCCTDHVTKKPYLYSVTAVPRHQLDDYGRSDSRRSGELSISISAETKELRPKRSIVRTAILVIVGILALLALIGFLAGG